MNKKSLITILGVFIVLFIAIVYFTIIHKKENPLISPSQETSQSTPESNAPLKDSKKCGDSICGPIEKETGNCPKDCADSESLSSSSSANNSFDADEFLWGTEIYPDSLNEGIVDILKNTLKTNNLKVRLQLSFFSKDGKTFSPTLCMPSANNCLKTYNFDNVAETFKNNNWNMIPMLSHDTNKASITSEDIDSYVNFVDWFIARYGNDANIKYVELLNNPNRFWKGTNEQLLELNNKTYDRIKNKYPSISMGTIGFEFWLDDSPAEKSIQTIEYFLDKKNGAKFDFWAFHGYPSITKDNLLGKKAFFYPPTKKAIHNKYAGVSGIIEIYKKFKENGWDKRFIIDTEHIGIVPNTGTDPSAETLDTDAAYTVQELILKRTLRDNSTNIISGIIPLKIAPRGTKGEFLFASLNTDGSQTPTVKAVSLLWDKLDIYKWDSHISGEFDKDIQPWIEKFKSENKELYVFFKPFEYKADQELILDNKISDYTLTLSKQPVSIKLTHINGDTENINPSKSIILKAINSPKYLELEY